MAIDQFFGSIRNFSSSFGLPENFLEENYCRLFDLTDYNWCIADQTRYGIPKQISYQTQSGGFFLKFSGRRNIMQVFMSSDRRYYLLIDSYILYYRTYYKLFVFDMNNKVYSVNQLTNSSLCNV